MSVSYSFLNRVSTVVAYVCFTAWVVAVYTELLIVPALLYPVMGYEYSRSVFKVHRTYKRNKNNIKRDGKALS